MLGKNNKKTISTVSKNIADFKKLKPLTKKDIKAISVLNISPFDIKQNSDRVKRW